MSKYTELVEILRGHLLEYGYTEFGQGLIDNVDFVVIIKPLRQRPVRYLCVIVEVPDSIQGMNDMKNFFGAIRRSLTREYAKSSWFKGLCTFSVLLCSHKLYRLVLKEKQVFKDMTGFHMNVMLGTCFIDKDTFENFGYSTWGLFHSGKHFGAIRTAVREYCERCRGRL